MNTFAPKTKALYWKDDSCFILDQTLLPKSEEYLRCDSYREIITAIQRLAVRGAPLIGIAGAYACALAVREAEKSSSPKNFLDKAFKEIEIARPTAVNLRWAVRRMQECFSNTVSNPYETLLLEAKNIHEDDIERNRKMASFGAPLFTRGASVLTCCNTGDLATGGIGTAFGVFRMGRERGLVSHVYACETRPVLQGMRLTAWELKKSEIPFTVICDNMAASLMREKKITHVITGADRIAANGDTANKIGTYSLAVLAKHHGIPFYIAAPLSTFDLEIKSGKDIPIEQRSSNELTDVLGNTPKDFDCYNPSFDVTPAELISAIICDKGVIHQPSVDKIRGLKECHV